MKKGPYKMKAGKEGPMRKNFPFEFKKDKAKASQTKTNIKTGKTTVITNPGSKSKAVEMPLPNINPGKAVKMPLPNINEKTNN
jgi:hypothetical protein